MKRRRFVAVSAATACPCMAVGCLGDSRAPNGAETDDDGGDGTAGNVSSASPKGKNRNDEDDEEPQENDDEDDEEAPQEEEDEPERAHEDGPILGYDLTVHDERRNGHPLWIDSEGRVYGRASNRINVSDDWYKTTETFHSFPRDHGTVDDFVQMVIVPDNGRTIVGRGGRSEKTTGRIEVLDKNRDESRVVYEFDWGRVSNSFGHAVYEDIIVIAAYGRSDFEANKHANEVVLSTDGGKSFELILEAELHTNYAPNLHIHDVEYDPYAERIWVVVGDGGNTQIYWSDDLGTTWETIDEAGKAPMLTQVVAFEDRIVFGTDGAPDGLIVWDRDDPSEKPAGVGDLEREVIIEEEQDGMLMYARRSWRVRDEDGEELCLMPFGYSPMQDEWRESVVLGTVDGHDWYELYRVDDEEVLITMIIGPTAVDGERRTLVSNSNFDGGYQIEATVPAFWEDEETD